MSLKTFFVSTLLAGAAVATSYESSYGGGGNSEGSGSWSGGGQGGGSEWSSWDNNKTPAPTWDPTWGAAPSCPAGCFPMPPSGVTPPPPAETQPGHLIVQVVSVADANGSLKYFPNSIEAPVGSIVQFQFHPKVCQFLAQWDHIF